MVSNNDEYNKKVLLSFTQSREAKRNYEHKELGFNYKMSNVVAGIGQSQLKVLDDRIARRKKYIKSMNKHLKILMILR